jgi:short subunit dehydrogenase-like uncharacterized protein
MTVLTRAFVLSTVVVAGAATALRADDLSVTMAPGVDISAFKTFAIRSGTIDSRRPELDNRLFTQTLIRAIRAALDAQGFKEATQADLTVTFTLKGEDFAVGDRPPARGLGPQPRRFTEGTLVIDVSKTGDADPIWRGTYRDDESTGSKLVQKLPDDARKLIDRLPKVR